jgi:hypothetical protein
LPNLAELVIGAYGNAGRFNPKDLIPDVAFIEGDAVFAQKVAIFVLERAGAMVFFLIVDVEE